jgi:hypothetical protein
MVNFVTLEGPLQLAAGIFKHFLVNLRLVPVPLAPGFAKICEEETVQ